MVVDLPWFVATMELELGVEGQARHASSHEGADREVVGWQLVESTSRGGLSRAAVGADQQRVQVDPAVAVADELHPVRAPVRLDRVAEVSQSLQGGRLVGGVEVTRSPTSATLRMPVAGRGPEWQPGASPGTRPADRPHRAAQPAPRWTTSPSGGRSRPARGRSGAHFQRPRWRPTAGGARSCVRYVHRAWLSEVRLHASGQG